MTYSFKPELLSRVDALLKSAKPPRDMDVFTFRKMVNVELNPLWPENDYLWLKEPDGSFMVHSDDFWYRTTPTEFMELQRMTLGAFALVPDWKPIGDGYGECMDKILDFKLRADAAREPHKRH